MGKGGRGGGKRKKEVVTDSSSEMAHGGAAAPLNMEEDAQLPWEDDALTEGKDNIFAPLKDASVADVFPYVRR